MERKTLILLRLGVIFLLVNINIGRWDILPDFAGTLMLAAAIEGEKRQREAERGLLPLLLLLSADYFLHWLMDFQNVLEKLVITMVYCYTIFVLFGETAERIRGTQPLAAGFLGVVRAGMALTAVVGFAISAYGNVYLDFVAACAGAAVALALVASLWKIAPVPENMTWCCQVWGSIIGAMRQCRWKGKDAGEFCQWKKRTRGKFADGK